MDQTRIFQYSQVKNSNGDTALDLATNLADSYQHTNKDDTELQQVIEVLRRYNTSRDSPYRHAYSLVQ